MPDKEAPYYFALGRLLARMRGHGGARSDGNWREAYFAGIAVYFISYFFAVSLFWDALNRWQAALVLAVLLFVMWIFWLLVLYVNSLLVKLFRICGLGADLPDNRIQSVLVGILTTIFAAQSLDGGWFLRGLGMLWLIAVALNLAAALCLALFYDERS